MHDKVKDYKDLVKDQKTGAILLKNHKIANDYLLKKQELEHKAMVESEINRMKDELQEIKSLLKELVNK